MSIPSLLSQDARAGRCGDCPIRHRAVCSQCEADELAILDQMKTYRTFTAGETIIWAGDPVARLGTVVKGCATLLRTMEDGRRQMVGLLFPSDFIGRPGRETTPYDVVAATEVTLCQFERQSFEDLLANTPSLERRLLQMTLDELDAAREWMLLLGRKSAREKIASFLTILARRDAVLRKSAPGPDMSFDMIISREALADYLGLTIETTSRQITALKNDGVIRLATKRIIELPDFERLAAEAGEDAA